MEFSSRAFYKRVVDYNRAFVTAVVDCIVKIKQNKQLCPQFITVLVLSSYIAHPLIVRTQPGQ